MAFLAPVGAALAGLFGTTGVAATTAAIIGTAGSVATAASLFSQPKAPKAQDRQAPITPSPAASLVDAQAAADNRRRTALLTGGQTNLTGGKALLQPADVKRKTLLGE